MVFKPQTYVCDAPSELSSVACRKIFEIIESSNQSAYPLSIALSGGSTPRALYQRMHSEHLRQLTEDRVLRFFLGDERLVSIDAPESNYNMAHQALLCDIPEDLVVPVEPGNAQMSSASPEGGEADAMVAAELYEQKIKTLLSSVITDASGAMVPVFDIVLLGLGADGHTASIFPGSRAEQEMRCAVSISFPSPSMSPKLWRVTLTPLAIKHARNVIVIASGEEKNWVVKGIFDENPTETPVSRFLRECKGEVIFILDKAIFKDVEP